MRIVVAPDKFKGSLTAPQVADAIARGLMRSLPDATCDLVPVADGGDGTALTVARALGGRMVTCEVAGPDGRRLQASYGLLPGDKAIVELAQASGLATLAPGTNDAATASTFGTGQLIADAIARGARRIVLAIGGSATTDAGAGALSALGARFLDGGGAPVGPGGAGLIQLASIDSRELGQRLAGASIEIACDVRNPLCGSDGAAVVYGPQKGASPKEVAMLDAAMRRFAHVAAATVGTDVQDVPGAGAAGGVGAGFLALAGATLRPGAQLVLELLDFRAHVDGADLVVTGEGRLDRQTLAGKAPMAVAQVARAQGVPVAAIAGSIGWSNADADEAGIAFALPIVTGPMSVQEAMQRAQELVCGAGELLGRVLRVVAREKRG